MKNIISIEDLCFSYSGRKIFNKLNLDIKEKRWLTIIGNNGSGKSTLGKLINGDYKYDGVIYSDANVMLLCNEDISHKTNDELSLLLQNIDVLILDNVLFNVKKLMEFRKKGLTIINITNNIEDSLIGDDILLLDEGKVILYDDKEEFYSNYKQLSKYLYTLPFIVDLSIKLKYYDVIDKIYFDMCSLVDAIWK